MVECHSRLKQVSNSSVNLKKTLLLYNYSDQFCGYEEVMLSRLWLLMSGRNCCKM